MTGTMIIAFVAEVWIGFAIAALMMAASLGNEEDQ